MSSEVAVKIDGVSKCYQIYDQPRDRLLQMLARGRRRYFREFWALKDISLEIKKGETVGIIGRNGSGKSTLLQIICGTLHPTDGNVQTNGRIAALLELGSGFNPEFTGRENVFLNGVLLGLTREEVMEKFDQIASFADIGDFMEQPVKTYSSGMYVRLAFAVIAHVDADILVIDEALSVGDIYFTQKCMLFLKKFQETGSVIFVTHDTSSVLALCNKAMWLNKGQLMGWGDARTVCESYLSDYYSLNRKTIPEENPLVEEGAYRRLSSGDFRDCRQDLVNASSIRNDLEFSLFSDLRNPTDANKDVVVEDVYFLDSQNQPVKWFLGGELTQIKIVFQTHIDLKRPIVGFLVKDKRGQALFGDNTFISHVDDPVSFGVGSRATASFAFRMPVMPAGEYTVGVAIASGTQDEHVMHTWVHDALIIESHSKSVTTGLLGIPMLSITMGPYVG